MNKWLLRILLILILLTIVGFYIYEVVFNDTPPVKHLFRTLSIVCICLAGLIRSFGSGTRNTLSFYEAQYNDIIADAFVEKPMLRKKLLCAARLFDEHNYDKALKYLRDLKNRAQYGQDHYAVNLFAALCFTRLGIFDYAERLYLQLIHSDLANSRIFSNLGNVQQQMGKFQDALTNYQHALDYDRNNAYVYNNLAQAYFENHQLDEAIPYATNALQINPKLDAASALLAIIYSLKNDKENAEKYFHMALSCGRDPEELKKAIAHYHAAVETDEEDET